MVSEIKMPRLGVNDDYITLVRWLVKDGDMVRKGQKIAEIETSKETNEIKADEEGMIHLAMSEGKDVAVGEIVATIGDAVRQKEVESTETGLRATAKAQKLIEENGIDISKLPKDRLIREKDVIGLIDKKYQIEEVKTNKVLIYGGGGFGKIAIEILKTQHTYELYGIVDLKYPDLKEILGIPVIGSDDDLGRLVKDGYTKIFNGIGFSHKAHWRKEPYEKLREFGFEFINVIHNSAQIEPSARMGAGNLVCAGAIIGSEAKIGSNCIINSGAVISHDCIISDHCHIASGAVIAGSVTIGENTLIGQNVTIYSSVVIGKNVTILNGCSVFRSVPDNTVVKENVQ